MFSKTIAIFLIFFILSIFVTSSKGLPEESTTKISTEKSQEKVSNSPQWNTNPLYGENSKKETQDKCSKCENLKKRSDNFNRIMTQISPYVPAFLRSKQNPKTGYETWSEYCKKHCPQHTAKNNSVENSTTDETTKKSNESKKNLNQNEITTAEGKETKKMKRHHLEDLDSAQNNNAPLERKVRSTENNKEKSMNNFEQTTQKVLEQRSDAEKPANPTKKEAANEEQEQTTSTISKTTDVPLEAAPTPTMPTTKKNAITTELPLTGAPPHETKLTSAHEFIPNRDLEYLYLSKKYKHLTSLLIEIENMLSDKMAAGIMKKILTVLKDFIICILDAVFTDVEQKMGINFPVVERKQCVVNSRSFDLFSFLRSHETTHSNAADYNSNKE